MVNEQAPVRRFLSTCKGRPISVNVIRSKEYLNDPVWGRFVNMRMPAGSGAGWAERAWVYGFSQAAGVSSSASGVLIDMIVEETLRCVLVGSSAFPARWPFSKAQAYGGRSADVESGRFVS